MTCVLLQPSLQCCRFDKVGSISNSSVNFIIRGFPKSLHWFIVCSAWCCIYACRSTDLSRAESTVWVKKADPCPNETRQKVPKSMWKSKFGSYLPGVWTARSPKRYKLKELINKFKMSDVVTDHVLLVLCYGRAWPLAYTDLYFKHDNGG